MLSNRERVLGALYGVVVGDALGVPVQFLNRAEMREHPVDGMLGATLPPGSWSDDSSLTLCLAASLSECGTYDPVDIGRRFIDWYDNGYLTPFGYAYDIGRTTAAAIDAMKRGVPSEQAGGKDIHNNGNGALMRIMPVILFALGTGQDHFALADRCGMITHAHGISRTAVAIYAQAAEMIMNGMDKTELLDHLLTTVDEPLTRLGLDEWLPYYEVLSAGAHLMQQDDADIASSGYVVDSLIAAMWAFSAGDTLEDILLKAVNLGGDTDTIAAIAGGLAGLYYGQGGIPEEWLRLLQARNMVDGILAAFGDRFFPA